MNLLRVGRHAHMAAIDSGVGFDIVAHIRVVGFLVHGVMIQTEVRRSTE